MNVLIYSGPEIVQTSLNHSLTSLKTVLLPHYTIQSVTQHILTTQPWQKSCALLVLPQPRGSFVSVASKHIKDFVEAGGSCLILGSSRATISSRSSRGNLGLGSGSFSWGEMVEEPTALPLQFFDKPNNRYISIDGDDDAAEEAAPRHVSLRSSDGIIVKGVYDSVAPASQLSRIHPNKWTSIVARYASDNDEEEQGGVACLSLNVSGGRLVLWIPNIEYPLSESPVVSNPFRYKNLQKWKSLKYYDWSSSADLCCNSVFSFPTKMRKAKSIYAHFRNFLRLPPENQL